jgi:glucokinase
MARKDSAVLAIGIDLGGTNLRWAVVDETGSMLFHRRQPTPQGNEATIRAIREEVAGCRQEFPEVVGAGVAVPGVVFGGDVTSTNLDWERFPLPRELQSMDLPCVVENDMNAGAFGEKMFGRARGMRDVIFLTVSTGIGAGIIIGGRIYRGFGGLAGEVGHTVVDLNGLLCGCGRRGCWEMIASGTAHRRRIREAFASGTWPKLTEEPPPDEVTRRAAQGDRAARALVLRTARYVGIGVSNLVNLYDPEAVVFTGGFARPNWELIHEYLLEEVRGQAFSQSTQLLLTELGDDAGILGAAALAFEAAREHA